MSEHLFGAAHRAHSLLDRHLTASLAMPTVELDAYSAEELVEAIRDLGELAEDANLIANRPPFMLADKNIGYVTPLGAAMQAIEAWCRRQIETAYVTLEAMDPSSAVDRHENESMAIDPETLMTERQTAELLNASVRTLQTWRLKGGGPKFAKLGSSVRYRRRDVVEFVEQHLARSTS